MSKSSTPTTALEHPDMPGRKVTFRDRPPGASTGSSRTGNRGQLRHPDIPSIQEEDSARLSDFYEVAPPALEVEETEDNEAYFSGLGADGGSGSLGKLVIGSQNSVKNPSSLLAASRSHQPINSKPEKFENSASRWRHRSMSLPAVHGNFILLNRVKVAGASTTTNSRSLKSPFQLQITASVRERPLQPTWAKTAAST